MRWRQDRETGEMVPIDAAARQSDCGTGIIVRGNFDPFVSTVDGTLISTHRDLEQHNKRNNVVSASEYSPEFYEQKARERARFYECDDARDAQIEGARRKYRMHGGKSGNTGTQCLVPRYWIFQVL